MTGSWRVLAALAMAVLAALAVCGPAATLALLPLSLLGGLLLPGVTTPLFGAVAVVSLAVAVQVVDGTRTLRATHAAIGLLALLLLAAYFLSAADLAPDPDRATNLISLLAGLALLAAVVASPPPPGAVARITALAGGLTAGCVLVLGERSDGRLQGLGLNPNYLGALLAVPLVAAVGLAWRRRVPRSPIWLLPAAVCLVGVAATQSRGACVAGAVGTAVVVLQGRSHGWQVLVVSAATAVGVAFPGVIGAAEHLAAGGRQAADLSQDSAIREHLARFAAHVVAGHPLRGIGFDLFPRYAERSPGLGIHIATHNDYLRLAAEAGIPALGAFLLLVGLGMRRPVSGDLAVLRAVAAAFATGLFFANELANLLMSVPSWLSLGCLLAAARPGTSLRHEEFHAHDQ